MFKNLKTIAIIALIAGPILIGYTYYDISQKEKINKEGVETAAIPKAKIESKSRKGSRSYKLDIEFPTGSGTHSSRVTVPKEIYDRIESNPVLKIKYLKEDPDKLILVGRPLGNPEMYGVGAAVFVLGAIGSWWYFLRKPKQPQFTQYGGGGPSAPPPIPQ
jgi:hypothetical protein